MKPAKEQRLIVQLEARHWPNRDHSRLMGVAGCDFHVQEIGDINNPHVLLLHGTAASTHSFAPLIEQLKTTHYCVAVDLPGHGFTPMPEGFVPTLPEMARLVLQLTATLELGQLVGIGHSAGAAILIEMASRAPDALSKICTINAALEPMRGHTFLSPLAKALFLNPLSAQLFAWRAQFAGMTKIMLRSTGSALSESSMRQYQFLLEDKNHVSGALAMMAAWELEPLQRKISNLQTPMILIAANDDQFVPARVSIEAAAKAPNARFFPLTKGGHLVHETDALTVADIFKQH